MHGAGAHETDNIRQVTHFVSVLNRLQKEHHECFVCLPQCRIFQEYNTDEYSEFLGSLISMLCEKYPNIDKSRIYLLGVSYGAYTAIYECLRHPERFAAAIPAVAWTYIEGKEFQKNMHLSGSDDYHSPFSSDSYNKLAKTPMWLAYSYLEAEYNEKLRDALDGIGATVKTTRIDRRGHFMFTLFFRGSAWTDWLFEQRKC